MDVSLAAYRGALKAHYPATSEITYAGKAFLCKAVAQWAQENKLWVDCTSQGEIILSLAGDVPRQRLVLHGVNKTTADLNSAVMHAGIIVVDNLTELHHLVSLFSDHSSNITKTPDDNFPDIWLRLQPGLAVATHHPHTQTGQHESKFGMPVSEIIEAAKICRATGLPLKGLHFHQGSNFHDTAPLITAINLGLELVQEIGLDGDWQFCPGGGWGVAYHEDELPQPDIESYVRIVAETVVRGCRTVGLVMPTLHLEPGRSLIARAGVAIYRVGTVKRGGGRTWLLIDGGVSDNPRHALYGSRYSCLPVSLPDRKISEHVSVGGPYCESGDVIIEDLPMPMIKEGELIAVPVSGAYHLSMSSNYNGALRPAVVWLGKDRPRLVVRRETLNDLSRRNL